MNRSIGTESVSEYSAVENRLDSFEQALSADSFSGNRELRLTRQIDKRDRGN